MQKIPTLYIRDADNPKRVTREVDPDCQWVIDGEGVATVKYDGSACLYYEGTFYRRHRIKPGKSKPPGWIHWDFENPEETGHGWAPVTDATSDQYHREAWDGVLRCGLLSGFLQTVWTFELVGPRLQGNPYRLERHELWQHGDGSFEDVPTGYDALAAWLEAERPMEGLVWHHKDGRMAKIKRRDFGLPWPVKETAL